MNNTGKYTAIKKTNFVFVFVLMSISFTTKAQANEAKKEIITSMDASALKWNNGDLDGYMSLYDSTATMMMQSGRVGVDSMRKMYLHYYFDNGKAKQPLLYDSYELTMLGRDYALLTGRFILKATTGKPERTGTFSLIFVHRKAGWKLLHDHSG